MAPGTKPPSSHQTRPPLASRLRASFELKRSKSSTKGHSRSGSRSEDLTSPTGESNRSPIITDGFLSHSAAQDAETLRIAIDQAISSDAFQNAIAVQLAKLIKPSIKSALDTIQPLVEAVYTHEVLLRKTNQNVEDALERMETNTNTSRRVSRIDPDEGEDITEPPPEEAPTAREIVTIGSSPDLGTFKQLVEKNCTQTVSAIAGLSTTIEANTTKIRDVAEGVTELKGTLGPSIDTLKASSEKSSTTVFALESQLDQLKIDVAQILAAIGSDLGKNVQAIQERSVMEPDTSFLSEQTTKLDNISTDLAALRGQSDTTGKIDTIYAELAVLRDSVESSIALHGEGITGLGSQITDLLSAIEGHTALLSDIKESSPHPDLLAAVQKFNDFHALNTTTLTDLKERSLSGVPTSEAENHSDSAVAISNLQSELACLKENIESGLNANGESLTSLSAKLDSISSTIEAQNPSDSSADILAAVRQSNESHANHAAALDSIKSVGSETPELSDLAAQFAGMISILEVHTAALEQIKVSNGDQTLALEGHGTVLESVRAMIPETSPAPTDGCANLEPHVISMISTLEAHTSALEELKSTSRAQTTALETYDTSPDGIRSPSATTDSPTSSVDVAALGNQVTTIISTLEKHSTILDEIKTSGDLHQNALENHGSALEAIKSAGGGDVLLSGGSNVAGVEAQIGSVVETLQKHTSVLEELQSTTASHATAFAERSVETTPDSGSMSDVDNKLGSLVSTLERHGSFLEEIKASSGSHGTVLNDIKTAHTTHSSALDEIKATTIEHGILLEEIRSPGLSPIATTGTTMPDTLNLAALDIQIGSIITTLSTHTSALADIGTKVGAANASTLSSDTDNPSLGDLNTVIEILDAHTAVLNEIKEDVAAEILTALHNIDQKQENCANLLVEVREGDVSEEVLTLLHGVGETANGHTVSLKSIYDAMQTSHGALAEFKSRDVASAEATSALVDLDPLEAQIAALHTVLGEHSAILSSIKDSANTSHDLHVAHGSTLEEVKIRSLEPMPVPDIVLPSFGGIEARLDNLVSSLDDHKSSLSAIRTSTESSQSSHASHAIVLDELKSRSIGLSPSSQVASFEGVESKIDALISHLDEHKEILSAVEETTKASNDIQSSHAASLEELKSRPVEVPNYGEIDAQLGNIVASLEEHKTVLSKMQESHGLNTASLDEIRSKCTEPASVAGTPDFSGLDTKLGEIATSMQEHKTLLSILQDLQGDHKASLDEIKAKTIDPDHISGLLSGMAEQKTTMAAVQEKTSASHDLHVTQAASLDEIKFRSVDAIPKDSPATYVEELKDQISGVFASLEEQKSALAELKDANSTLTDTHSVLFNILNEVTNGNAQSKECHASHAIILGELKAVPEPSSPDLSAIEAHLNTILTTMESQTEVLATLKETNVYDEVHGIIKQSHELLNTNHELLLSHTITLTELKEGSPHPDITSSLTDIKALLDESKSGIDSQGELVKELDSSTKDRHSSLISAIAALTLGGVAGAGTSALLSDDHESSAEVLAEIKAVRAIAEASQEDIGSVMSQIDAKHTAYAASLVSIRQDLKSDVDIIGTKITDTIAAVHGEVEAIDLTQIHASLEQHDTNFTSIAAQLETIDGNLKAIDSLAINAALEQHGSDIKGVATQLVGLDESLQAIDVAAIHTSLEQHGSKVQGLAADIKSIDLAPVNAALVSHGAGIDNIRTQLEGVDGSIKEATLHVQELHDGVRLNDAGVQQLQSHVVVRQAPSSALSEGPVFKRDSSLSPVTGRKSPMEKAEDEGVSSLPSIVASTIASSALIGCAAALLSTEDDNKLEDPSHSIGSIEEQQQTISSPDQLDIEENETGASDVDLMPAVEEIESSVRGCTDETVPFVEIAKGDQTDDVHNENDSIGAELAGAKSDLETIPITDENESVIADFVHDQLPDESYEHPQEIRLDTAITGDAQTESELEILEENQFHTGAGSGSEMATEVVEAKAMIPTAIEAPEVPALDEPTLDKPFVDERDVDEPSLADPKADEQSNSEEAIEEDLPPATEVADDSEATEQGVLNSSNDTPHQDVSNREVFDPQPEDAEVRNTDAAEDIENSIDIHEPIPTAVLEVDDDDDNLKGIGYDTNASQPLSAASSEAMEESSNTMLKKSLNSPKSVASDLTDYFQESVKLTSEASETDSEMFKSSKTIAESEDITSGRAVENFETFDASVTAAEDIQVESKLDGVSEPLIFESESREVEGMPDLTLDSSDKIEDDAKNVEPVLIPEAINKSKSIDLDILVAAGEAESNLNGSDRPTTSIKAEESLEDDDDDSNIEEPETSDVPDAETKGDTSDVESELELPGLSAQNKTIEAVNGQNEDLDAFAEPTFTPGSLNEPMLAHVDDNQELTSDNISRSASLVAEEYIPAQEGVGSGPSDGNYESDEILSKHHVMGEEINEDNAFDARAETLSTGSEDSVKRADAQLRNEILEVQELGATYQYEASVEADHLEPSIKDARHDSSDTLETTNESLEIANADIEDLNVPVPEPKSDIWESPITSIEDELIQNETGIAIVADSQVEDLEVHGGIITHKPNQQEEIGGVNSDSERDESVHDIVKSSPAREHHNQHNLDSDKSEAGPSPTLLSSVHDSHIAGDEDPFSDAPASTVLPSYPQVQSLSYASPFPTLSHMSEPSQQEPQLREIASSQLENPHELLSSQFDDQGLSSSPFIEQPESSEINYEENREEASARSTFSSNATQPSLSTQNTPLSQRLSEQQYEYHTFAIHEQEVGGTCDIRAASPSAQPPISQHSAAVNSSEVDYEQQRTTSRPSSASSGSAFDSFSPRAPSPKEQDNYNQFAAQSINNPERQSRDIAQEDESTSRSPSQAQSCVRQHSSYLQERRPERSFLTSGSPLTDHQNPTQGLNNFTSELYTQGSEQEYDVAHHYKSDPPSPGEQQSLESVARNTGGYSRRSTMEDHAAPTTAPGAAYYASSATESHYSISEHPDVSAGTDPFAPMYDAYSPTDVVNEYADYTPSLHGQTPVTGHTEYFQSTADHTRSDDGSVDHEETRPLSITTENSQNQYSVRRDVSPSLASPSLPRVAQNSGYLSYVDGEYIQQGNQRPEFDILPLSSQHSRYNDEILNPYSQHDLLDRDYGSSSLPVDISHGTGNTSPPVSSLSERLPERIQNRHLSTPKLEYIALDDERYIPGETQDQSQSHLTTPMTPTYKSRYGDSENETSPPDTGHFQQQFGSRNPFAASTSQSSFPTLTPGRGIQQNTLSPVRNHWSSDHYLDDAASVQQRYLPRELPESEYEDELVSARSDDRFSSDVETEQRYQPRELLQSGIGGIKDEPSNTKLADNAGEARSSSSQGSRYQEDREFEDELPATTPHQPRDPDSQDRWA